MANEQTRGLFLNKKRDKSDAVNVVPTCPLRSMIKKVNKGERPCYVIRDISG